MSWLSDLLSWLRRKPPLPLPDPAPDVEAIRQRLLTLLNAQRQSMIRLPLRRSPLLDTAAQQWAESMARAGRLDHGATGQRLREAGYLWSACVENIAEGQPTADAAVQDWMNSPGHRANILGAYRDVGFGAAQDARGQWYWCADFATP